LFALLCGDCPGCPACPWRPATFFPEAPGRAVQNESLMHGLLVRAFTSQEIDSLKQGAGQVKDLARSAYGLAAEVLDLHARRLGPVAIARELQVSRKSVTPVIARARR
jgi:hypothetical protein